MELNALHENLWNSKGGKNISLIIKLDRNCEEIMEVHKDRAKKNEYVANQVIV